MNSENHSDTLDLVTDLPTTQTDIEVLRRLRSEQQISFADALMLLSNFNAFPSSAPDRRLPIGWEPFRL